MRTRFPAELLLVVTTLLAAGGWVFSKQAIQELPRLALLAYAKSRPRFVCCHFACMR